MLSFGFPEVLVLIGVAAVIGLSIAALVEAAGRPDRAGVDRPTSRTHNRVGHYP